MRSRNGVGKENKEQEEEKEEQGKSTGEDNDSCEVLEEAALLQAETCFSKKNEAESGKKIRCKQQK
jgi:hypothetical protein